MEQTQEQLSEHQKNSFYTKSNPEKLGMAKDDRESDTETFSKRLKDKELPSQVSEKIVMS